MQQPLRGQKRFRAQAIVLALNEMHPSGRIPGGFGQNDDTIGDWRFLAAAEANHQLSDGPRMGEASIGKHGISFHIIDEQPGANHQRQNHCGPERDGQGIMALVLIVGLGGG